MTDNRLKWLVFAALLLNAAAFAFFWFDRPKPPRPPHEIIVDALGMDAAQQAAYTLMHRAHRRTTDSLLQNIASIRKQLYSRSAPAAPDSLFRAIGQMQAQIEAVTFQHFEDVRGICRPEQQGKLDELLLETVQRVTQQGRKGKSPPR